MKVCNYLKNGTGVDPSKFPKNVELANFKSNVDKLEVDQLVSGPVHLSKLSDVVTNDVIKKNVYNAKIKNIEDKISDIINMATNTTLNAEINEAKGEIPTITNLATISTLNAKINKVKTKYLILLTNLLLKLVLLLKIKYLMLVI